jgi:N-hydroxyarylamine O-acetyltransferase
MSAPADPPRGDDRVTDYLARLGVEDRLAPTLEHLRHLHVAHLERVPFENLSVTLAEDIVLDHEALVTKVVDRGRGGFCYELNGAFAALLSALGFGVTMLEARVVGATGLGPPYDHMALRVEVPGAEDEPWLVDVGFGDSFRLPLRLAVDLDQVDPAGTFRIVAVGEHQLELHRDGQPQYRFDLTPRQLADYVATCWYHRTSPDSHFTSGPVCSIATPSGRVTIRDRRLILTEGTRREEQELSDAEVLAAYREHFGIELDAPPARVSKARLLMRPTG